MKSGDDWSPFTSRAGFELAEILYTTAALSNDTIDRILDIWAATLVPHNNSAPLTDHHNLHSTIDAIKLGHVPWQSYTARYNGLRPENGPTPEWMTTDYQVWYRDPRKVIHTIFSNPDLVDGIDYVPYREFDSNGKRRYCDFMSADWAWKQCVRTFFPEMSVVANPILKGPYFCRSGHPWHDLHSCYTWQRQNYRLRGNWTARVPSSVPLSWERPQPSPPCP